MTSTSSAAKKKKRVKLITNNSIYDGQGQLYYFFKYYKIFYRAGGEIDLDIACTLNVNSYNDKVTVNYSRTIKNKYVYEDSKVYGINLM